MFYQTKKSLHLLLVAVATMVAIALLWHFGVSPIEPSAEFGGRFAGLTCLMFGGLHHYKSRTSGDTITKGTRLVTPKKFNSIVKGDGIGIPFSTPGWSRRSDQKPGLMRIRASDHSCHISVTGDSGTGKSAIFHTLLGQIREEGTDAAILYDPSGEYYKYWGNQDTDILLYPFAKDSVYWNLTEEITCAADAQALAKSFIPDKADGGDSFWTIAPRKILAFLLMELKRQNGSTTDLIRWIADGEYLTELVSGTALEPLIDPGAASQRTGVLASLSLLCDALEILPPNDGRKVFSFRAWAKKREGFIFIPTAGTRERVAMKPLISAMLDTAFNCTMDVVGSKPVWYFVDEMPSLAKLPSLETALYEGRKYGNQFCLGFQGRSQLQALYGKSAEAIMSSSTTKIFLRTSEYDAAEWCSKGIGKPEKSKSVETFSSSLLSNGRDSVSTREDLHTDYLVIPNEIQVLPKLQGYLAYDGYAVKFAFPYPKLTEQNKFPETTED